MSEKTPHGRKPKPKIQRREIRGVKLLAPILRLLAPRHDQCPDPKRTLHYDQYCAWLLIYFFTLALDSLRGLQQASDIDSLRKRLKLPRFSLGGSFATRVRNNLVYETLEERPLAEADKRQGIRADRIVRAGHDSENNPVRQALRLVEIRVPGSKSNAARKTDRTLLPLTDRTELDVSAVALWTGRNPYPSFFFLEKTTTRRRPKSIAPHSQNTISIPVPNGIDCRRFVSGKRTSVRKILRIGSGKNGFSVT
jgi:hypothetical protein